MFLPALDGLTAGESNCYAAAGRATCQTLEANLLNVGPLPQTSGVVVLLIPLTPFEAGEPFLTCHPADSQPFPRGEPSL